MTGLRLTWVQPEDLVVHELRQADEDGRDAREIRARWARAGGSPAPPRDGASASPAPPELRVLAHELLDELALLPSPLAEREPTPLALIKAACPAWPATPPPADARGRQPVSFREQRPAGDAQSVDRPPEASWPGASGSRAAQSTTPFSRAAPRSLGAGGLPPGSGWGYSPGLRRGHPHPGEAPGEGRSGERRPRPDALHASWLGRAIGCLLGKPVEKLPLHAIRGIARATGNWPLHTWFTAKGLPPDLAAAHPWNRRSADTSLAENIDGMPEDDDLNYPLLNLLLLQRHGKAFTTAQLGRLWLDELPAGRTFTAERVAYRNLLSGVEPPLTAAHRNPFREWIGAAIRADMHGWTHPGDPAAAATQAHRDASLTHTANGIYGAMFIAATIAAGAGGRSDVHQCLRTGLTVIPPRSRLAKAIRLGIDAARAEPGFDIVVDRLHTALGHHHWVHVIPNAALLAAALTHADGDFTGSICRAVSGGWDTDSNGATAGSIAGLLAGHPAAIPDRWTIPLKNRLATSVAGFDGVGFDTLAHLTRQEAVRP
ncbi:ADP-ribosylglycohydrolase family protein [Streptomyces sp. ISL-1]|uniref:ADP-ribosylglycohydrolase family protein n=1 Tax=Streptomyces sp. ISL-1 TaxID=2817657 RepID=UPI001BE94740|nr:ADP-ribosylglycohydrolase family protein [Streptomyces sp. ISL-1]MBT2392873.1 ADP-ribosylglycohydrolase family protein [Streptomyces sp. ISL-1]